MLFFLRNNQCLLFVIRLRHHSTLYSFCSLSCLVSLHVLVLRHTSHILLGSVKMLRFVTQSDMCDKVIICCWFSSRIPFHHPSIISLYSVIILKIMENLADSDSHSFFLIIFIAHHY